MPNLVQGIEDAGGPTSQAQCECGGGRMAARHQSVHPGGMALRASCLHVPCMVTLGCGAVREELIALWLRLPPG